MEQQEMRDQIVAAMVSHVVFDGWTQASLRSASADVGIDAASAARAFPGGLIDVIDHFLDLGDRQMLAELEKQNLQDINLRQRITLAIRIRLEQVGGDREVLRRTLSVLVLPMYSHVAMQATARTVDAVWRAVGDDATDFSYYSKRFVLAGIYSATLLFWLADSSEDSSETWDFLERRVEDVVRLGKLREEFTRRLSFLPTPKRLFDQFRGRGLRGGRAEFKED